MLMCVTGQEISPSYSQLRVFQFDLRRDSRWEEFVNSHPDALIYHHPDWLTALEEEYGRECIALACEGEHGELRGILPLFRTLGFAFGVGRNATGARFSSLPRTPVAGPLAVDPSAMEQLVRCAVELTRTNPGTQLEIKTSTAGLSASIPELCEVPWRSTFVEELPAAVEGKSWDEFWERIRIPRNCGVCKDCRRLRFGNAKQQHRVNWSVNKAIKSGLTVREADSERDLAKWHSLYLQTMRHNAVPPRSYRFFLSLWSTMRPKGRLRLLVAEQEVNRSKRMVAGSVVMKYGQTVFYAFTGCAPRDLGLHPHDLIQIESIRDACKNGFRWYDMGEVAEEHQALGQFKMKWGAEPRPLYRYYFPARVEEESSSGSRGVSTLRKVWRRLPLRATQILGDVIYSRL